jgi:hypothetical protein
MSRATLAYPPAVATRGRTELVDGPPIFVISSIVVSRKPTEPVVDG